MPGKEPCSYCGHTREDHRVEEAQNPEAPGATHCTVKGCDCKSFNGGKNQ